MESNVILFFFILPFLGAFTIPLISTIAPGAVRFVAAIVTLSLLILSVFMVMGNPQNTIYIPGGWYPLDGIPIGIHLECDGLSRFMLLIINVLAFFCALFAISYMKTYTGQKYFYALYCLQLAGLNGVVLSGDLFNLFVFMEVTAKASYALVAFRVRKTEIEASFKYQVMGGLASLFLLFGIALLYWMTSTLNMGDMAQILRSPDFTNVEMLRFAQVFIISGIAIKAAMMPFHAWLPDAHSSAPSPVSAMLSGVVIKTLGIYVLMRLFIFVFEPDAFIAFLFAVMGGVSMVAGVILAIGAWDLKRLLAYHSISQMGYVVMGLGLGMNVMAKGGSSAAVTLTFSAALFHMLNHAIFKGLLFLNAGSLEYATGTIDLKRMGGLWASMPISMISAFVASFAIAGIPPFNGFFSKFAIVVAAIEGGYYFRAVLGIGVGILTMASFAKFLRYAFFGRPTYPFTAKESPHFMLTSLISLSILCLVTSLLIFSEARAIIIDPAVEVLINKADFTIKDIFP